MPDSLKDQVRAEIKKRRYVTYTLLFAGILYVAANLLFGDMGLLRHRELRGRKAAIEKELNAMRMENNRIRSSIRSYKEKDFYTEKNARENFGLAGKDEYIFLYETEPKARRRSEPRGARTE